MKKFFIILILLLPFGAMATVLRYMAVEPDQPSHLADVPLQIDGWNAEVFPVGDATAAVLQATDILLRGYTDSSGNYVGLYIAYFHDQKYGSQIHSPRHCLPGGGWVLTGLEHVPFDLGDRQINVNRMTIAKRSRVDQMFYWFHTRSGDLASEYSLKFDLVRNSLLLSPTDAVIIRLTVGQTGKTVEECQRLAERFMQTALPDIRKALPFSTI
ncbi:MAG: exosortase C-terminal domain/associated protein EpsI [Candidatus Zixiibacteriota bacterium]